jgi:DUF1016 N-terminal domain
MRQFYEVYKDYKAAAPLIRNLSWSSNLLILSRCKSPEEREFYLRLAYREGWDKRETDRQLRGALFERAILDRPKVSPAVTQLHSDAEMIFKDSYLVDFLNLPEGHSEQELPRAIIMNYRLSNASNEAKLLRPPVELNSSELPSAALACNTTPSAPAKHLSPSSDILKYHCVPHGTGA